MKIFARIAFFIALALCANDQTKQVDIAYVYSGDLTQDLNSIERTGALVVRLNSDAADSGVHYNLVLVTGLADLHDYAESADHDVYGVAHGEYAPDNSYSGNVRTFDEGITPDSGLKEDPSVKAGFYCGMIQLLSPTEREGHVGTISVNDIGDQIAEDNGHAFTPLSDDDNEYYDDESWSDSEDDYYDSYTSES